MSSNTAIAILKTSDRFRKHGDMLIQYPDGPRVVFRVAILHEPDEYRYLLENELHNLGVWMQDHFDPEGFETFEEAHSHAIRLLDEEYTEYGIIKIDLSGFNFPHR